MKLDTHTNVYNKKTECDTCHQNDANLIALEGYFALI